MFEITVEDVFAASHALRLPDGSFEPMHGHNWHVRASVACEQLDAIETVMDFHDLKDRLAAVLEPFRNRHLNDVPPFAEGEVNPSAERVAWWIGTRLSEGLPDGVALTRVTVTEAPGCEAAFVPGR